MWPYSGAGADLPAAHADRAHRVPVDRPVDDVDVVDVLLDDVVARQPGEVQPVADLPLERRTIRGCRSWFHRLALVPVTRADVTSPIAPSWIRFIVSM